MKPSEQEKLCLELTETLKQYIETAYQIEEVVGYLFQEWEHRKTHSPLGVSKLGIDYNSSVTGLNGKIRDRINRNFQLAKREVKSGNKAAKHFLTARLHPKLLLDKSILNLIKTSKDANLIVPIEERLAKVRSDLVFSVYNMIESLAAAKIKKVNGNIIEIDDLIQQGVLAAYDATLTFNINENTKWSSYVYMIIEKAIEKYIIERSRTVNLPKYVIERWAIVSKAITQLGGINSLENLVLLSNKMLAEQKVKLLDRKLKVSELYTKDEIENLLMVTQNSCSLDLSETDERSTYELVRTDEISSLDIDKAKTIAALPDILDSIIDKDDWPVLKIKWGFETGATCTTHMTIEIYKNKTGIELNNGKIRSIETKAIQRLRGAKNKELLEMWEAFQERLAKL